MKSPPKTEMNKLFLSIVIAATLPWGARAQNNCTNGLEADVSPWGSSFPSGDNFVTYLDFAKILTFALGTAAPADSCQFARADCAPRSSLGDGLITIADAVQAIRYSVGLDPLQYTGGPSNVIPTPRVPGIGPRSLAVLTSTFARGQDGAVAIHLNTAGDETAVGFTLKFDPTLLQYKSFFWPDGTANLSANTNGASGGRLAFVAVKLGRGVARSTGGHDLPPFSIR